MTSLFVPASIDDLVAVDDETAFFWDGVKAGQLLLNRCENCRKFQHPPRPVCRYCLSTRLRPEQISGLGTLYTYTVAVQPFHPYFRDKVPYVIVTVQLDDQEDLKMVSNLIGCAEEDIRIGMRLQFVIEEQWPGVKVPLVRPLDTVATGA